MVIKTTGLPGNTVKFVPSQEQSGTFTVGKMQAGKKNETTKLVDLYLAADTHKQQN